GPEPERVRVGLVVGVGLHVGVGGELGGRLEPALLMKEVGQGFFTHDCSPLGRRDTPQPGPRPTLVLAGWGRVGPGAGMWGDYGCRAVRGAVRGSSSARGPTGAMARCQVKAVTPANEAYHAAMAVSIPRGPPGWWIPEDPPNSPLPSTQKVSVRRTKTPRS